MPLHFRFPIAYPQKHGPAACQSERLLCPDLVSKQYSLIFKNASKLLNYFASGRLDLLPCYTKIPARSSRKIQPHLPARVAAVIKPGRIKGFAAGDVPGAGSWLPARLLCFLSTRPTSSLSLQEHINTRLKTNPKHFHFICLKISKPPNGLC